MDIRDSKHLAHQRRDRGFTLVEILVVIAILGIVAVVVAFSVRGMTDRGEVPAVRADARTLTRSGRRLHGRQQVDVLPAIGATPNRYELA